VITKADLRSILSSAAVMGVPIDVTDEQELAIDSFTLVKLQLALEEQHGVVIEPKFKDMNFFTSINGVYEYLAQRFPGRVAAAGDNNVDA
jgi:acyl carrier protein